MTYLFRKMTVGCGLAGMLALGAAAPSLAQVVVDPYYGGAYGYVSPYGHAGPYGYVSPYQGYAYVPGYRGRRAWDYPLGYDNTGRPYPRRPRLGARSAQRCSRQSVLGRVAAAKSLLASVLDAGKDGKQP
jgi:hypothetical protein